MRAANRLSPRLRKADVSHVAGLDHLCDRTDCLLDRDGRVHPTQMIDVDAVRAQPLQRVRESVLHSNRPPVDAGERVVRCAKRSELHADHGGVPIAALQSFADEELVVAHA